MLLVLIAFVVYWFVLVSGLRLLMLIFRWFVVVNSVAYLI